MGNSELRSSSWVETTSGNFGPFYLKLYEAACLEIVLFFLPPPLTKYFLSVKNKKKNYLLCN